MRVSVHRVKDEVSPAWGKLPNKLNADGEIAETLRAIWSWLTALGVTQSCFTALMSFSQAGWLLWKQSPWLISDSLQVQPVYFETQCSKPGEPQPSGDKAIPYSVPFLCKNKTVFHLGSCNTPDAYCIFQTWFKTVSTPPFFLPVVLLFLVRCVLFSFHFTALNQACIGRPCFWLQSVSSWNRPPKGNHVSF